MAKIVLEEVGCCIYCGSTEDLSDEHIIPFFLYGDHILAKASCRNCARITSQLEDNVGRHQFGKFRAFHGLRTRKPKMRQTHYQVEIENDKGSKKMELSIKEVGAIHIFPVFEAPRIVFNETETNGIKQTAAILTFYGGVLSGEELLNKINCKKFIVHGDWNPSKFARMLAKIAYGCTVAVYGLENIETAFVLPAIKGEENDVGTWVGTSSEDLQGEEDMLYVVRPMKTHVEVLIKIFGKIKEAPTYRIIVGTIKAGTKMKDLSDKGVVIRKRNSS